MRRAATARPARRFAPLVVGLLLAVTASVLPASTSYAAGPTPDTAEPIAGLPFNTGVVGKYEPQQAATGAANANLSTACNNGLPMYRVRWFSYTPTATTKIVARGEMYAIGQDRRTQGSGVAILTSTLGVIDCNVIYGGAETPSYNQTVPVAGPSEVSAGTRVYIVQFAREDTANVCNDACLDFEANLTVRRAGDYPLSDDLSGASPITKVPFSQTVDTTLATQGYPDSYLGVRCDTAVSVTRSVWWTLTPTETGKLVTSLTPARYALTYAELTNDGPRGVDSCTGPPTLEKGKTYAIMAGIPGYNRADEALTGEPVTLTVQSGPALGKPDLVVTKVVSSPASPKAGDPVTFRATIKNQGTAPTQGGVTHGVAFRVDGATKTWSDVFNASVPPGQSVTLSSNGGVVGAATFPATPGSHTVTAIVDDVNRIPDEANENNNTKTSDITVAAGPDRPDLVVTGLSFTPAHPTAGATVTFKATVQNQGTGATPAGTIVGVAFRVNGVTKSWSDTFTTALGPGASTSLTANGGPAGTATWPATNGQRTLTAIVDDVQRIRGESSETNNTRSVALNVGPDVSRPDLVITGVSFSPVSPAPGASVRSYATIKNIGTRSIPEGDLLEMQWEPQGGTCSGGACFNLRAWYSGRTSTLHPGQTIVVSSNGGGGPDFGLWKPTAGSIPVTATVDHRGRIPELDEANNTLNTVLTTG